MNYIDIVKKQEDNKRFDEYKRNKLLYEGEHYLVFKMSDYEYYTQKDDYLVYNFLQILTDAFVDLLWTEEPKITVNNQDYLDDLIQKNDWIMKLREACTVSSYNGDCILKLNLIDGQINLSIIDNKLWYPIINEFNKEITGHIIKYERELKDDKKEVYLLEIHTKGKIEYQSYIENDDNTYSQIDCMKYFSDIVANLSVKTSSDLTLSIDTNCDYPLVFQLSNIKNPNHAYGISDYSLPLIAKNKGINKLLNQAQYVLKKHAHPKMIVPKQVINQAIAEIKADDDKAKSYGFESSELVMQNYHSNKSILETIVAQKIVDKLEYFGSDINSGDPKYLTWDGNLDESRQQIELLKQSSYDEAQLSKILVDPTLNTGNLSGVAILRLANQSINKTKKKQLYIKNIIKKLIYTAMQLDNVSPEYAQIHFKDGLVNDLKETIENEILQLDANLTSRKEAIITINQCSENQAEMLMSDIENEKDIFTPNIEPNLNEING